MPGADAAPSYNAPAARAPAPPRPLLSPSAGDPVVKLRQALSREIAAAVAAGRGSLVPLGKWLAEDLILAADRLASGVSRRAAELLGLPDSTYRRQLQAASARRTSGLSVRSPTWADVTGLLDDFINARRDDTDVCQWAEAGLLAESSRRPGSPDGPRSALPSRALLRDAPNFRATSKFSAPVIVAPLSKRRKREN